MIVSVAFPITIDGLYDYKVPEEFEQLITRGVPVKVSLRNRVLWGVVIEVKEKSDYDRLKSVMEIKKEDWSSSSESLITLYHWISSYYHSPINKIFRPLIKKSVAEAKAKEVNLYRKKEKLPSKLTEKQKIALNNIPKKSKPYTLKELQNLGLNGYMVNKLCEIGALRKVKSSVMREIKGEENFDNFIESSLSDEQLSAVNTIWDGFHSPAKPTLIHGITGSGKTYIYIELTKRALKEGKGVIILVPEIGLTPQTINRFSSALNTKIAVMHSRMSDGERRDSIALVVSGERRVVIGVRSTILMPMPDLGLIIVDEEHDSSYKQSDPEPRYHARDVAIMRGHLQKALVVLGSATPSLETYYNAKIGKYNLITLNNRYGNSKLPTVSVVDMNKERSSGNWSPFSNILLHKIKETISHNKQVILLLNRRGYAVSLACGSCGNIRQCPKCAVNLVYHSLGDKIMCHHCGYVGNHSHKCEVCGGEEHEYNGIGIQKIEDFLVDLFPNSRIIRMDQDTTSRKGSHSRILNSFGNGEFDILLGTQMVSKGLSFSNVTLVGVLQADTGMSIPDFRASERLFQLLTQVEGRAGRGDHSGEVIVQTLSPNNPAVQFASKHDYIGFYNAEIEDRREAFYPPYSRIARIIIISKFENYAIELSKSIKLYLQNIEGLTILGPTEALFKKLKEEFRYSILLKSESYAILNYSLECIEKRFPPQKLKNLRYKIDVDAVSMT